LIWEGFDWFGTVLLNEVVVMVGGFVSILFFIGSFLGAVRNVGGFALWMNAVPLRSPSKESAPTAIYTFNLKHGTTSFLVFHNFRTYYHSKKKEEKSRK
jgi:hypothetical protein